MNKETVLIIGYGSIGKRHAKILKKNKKIDKIFILTNQKINDFHRVKSYSAIKKINPTYFIISSRTSNHYKDLNFIIQNFKSKKILVEKPLFDKFKKIKNLNNNKVFIGYNLRLNPVIQYLKKYLTKKKVFHVGLYCHSYLPDWRKKINYQNSNSAKKKYGGGVLLELSHELDYLQFLFNDIKKIYTASIKKFSNLITDTEDFALITGKTKKVNFVVDLNYFSRNNQRIIIINGFNFSMRCDLINNFVELIKNKKKKIIRFKKDIDYTYDLENKLIINNTSEQLCNFKQGLKLIKLIDKIKKKVN